MANAFWKNKKVLVTGLTGFLGRHLAVALRRAGAEVLPVGSWVRWVEGLRPMDMRDRHDVRHVFQDFKPEYVFHLAGFNGGIDFNVKYPADIFYQNTAMALNLFDAARQVPPKKVVSVVASCAYPAAQTIWKRCEQHDPNGFFPSFEMGVTRSRETCPEAEFLDGPPHDSVMGHAYAKRNLQVATHLYHKQYGLSAVCVCPTTLYGPHDSFDPHRTKLMGGMVKRFVDAADNNTAEVTCWGSGKPLREFLYVEDAAKLLLKSMELYEDSSRPLNLGTGQEISVADLATLVARAAGYRGNIRWDTSRPDGQHRKRLDTTKMLDVLGEQTFVPLEDGVRRTADYYRASQRRPMERHDDVPGPAAA